MTLREIYEMRYVVPDSSQVRVTLEILGVGRLVSQGEHIFRTTRE